MVLSRIDVLDKARELLKIREGEQTRLEKIHEYHRDQQRLMFLPSGVPREVHLLAKISRVNVLRFVVRAATQAMFVDGFREERAADDAPAWELWQRNRLDKRQIGVHRAALKFGASYTVVLPGDRAPVIRGASPRKLTAAYGDDDEWPEFALEMRGGKRWRLLDAEAAYPLEGSPTDELQVAGEPRRHGAGVCPVVRFRDTEDLDEPVVGIVEPHIPLQDQINVTSFGLLVAQHFGAFRQRYILGWLAESEEDKLKVGASRMVTLEEHPDDLEVGEWGQTDTGGYLKGRESLLQILATVSQTPVHELLGQMVNLSAEALAAARDSHNRAVGETTTCTGESWEQTLALAGDLASPRLVTDPSAYVRWRDMEARSLAQTADALGKLAQMLGVPAQELWERVPGVSQQEIERWKAAAETGDALGNLTRLLDRQAGAGAPGEQTSPGGVILPGGAVA